MNRRAATILFALSAFAAMAGTPAPAAFAATPTSNVTISAHVDFRTSQAAWTSDGVVDDSGWVIPTREIFGSLIVGSGVATQHEDLVFTGQAGSFTIRQQLLLAEQLMGVTTATSHWVILDGTGTYVGASGHGTGTLMFNWIAGTLDAALLGAIRLDSRLN
jgi:hypothetical protein